MRYFLSPISMLVKCLQYNSLLFPTFCSSLQDKKDLNPGTISNHIGGILYVLKFLNKESAPKYQGVALISQLRSLATELQKQGKQTYALDVM